MLRSWGGVSPSGRASGCRIRDVDDPEPGLVYSLGIPGGPEMRDARFGMWMLLSRDEFLPLGRALG